MSRVHYFDALVLSGVSIVTGVYVTGLPDLLGSRAQVIPVFLGVLAGGFIVGAVSSTVFRRVSLLYSAILAAFLVGVEAYYVSTLPLVGYLELAALFALACSPIIPLGRVLSTGTRPPVRAGWLVVSMGAGVALFFSASVVAYAARGYSGLPLIVLAVDGVGFILVLSQLAAKRVRTKRRGGGGAALDGYHTSPQVGVKIGVRRTFVTIALAGFMVTLILASPVAQANQDLGLATRTPIKHVIFIMMENHSFDNLFGVYPTNNATTPSGLTAQLTKPVNLLDIHPPAQLKAVPTGVYFTADPVEGYIAYHRDWAGGMMSGFASNSGPQSMTYYTSAQMGVEWDLAEQYALADMYFASQLSETAPNRLYSLAGFSPVVNDYGPPPYIPFSESIFAELNNYGVSWAYYVDDPSDGVATLSYFQGIAKYSSHIQSWNQFLEELGNNTLPAVSWLMPIDGGAEGYSQGPPSSVLQGELWLLYIVNTVEHSPEWNTTAIFITYDEGGGYYDQVPPPTLYGTQLGQRVPMLLISPYAKEDYVSNTLLTHTSLLAFVDYNWRLPALNPLVLHSNIPIDMFNFNTSYPQGYTVRPPIPFQQLGFPVPPTIYASSYQQPSSLSQLFPMTPQISLDSLPYPRTGSSHLNLANISSQVYIENDQGYTPAYANSVTIALLYIIMLGITYEAVRRT
ncbi:hypothetical protein B9Q03_02765 [Candidatus Marsarchaeota G2 archaeon OSP_D]|jgi:hypothetical protein|uniref:Acid phosphatase n=5 Tax=Candidatus Marsarchaeota group 2 TaxID=2203771 RepID=A0A2R6CDM1_9ARCH|nr:MAG: hypothetical protein B9Q03_02765 [Candidatus Marsarchaeota G2 archaeon OSP_D]PSN95794.1 MAG: hypothetical protein B9Q06_04245 [Candidatus Marsarchaeota G2 archaeon ECH_B_2]PSO00564.1 MAG: hypothetical protein B9Q07_03075 [Candidatus Marsarchaeota G2 archaeon ECH_B_3]PSO03159.1 MAG: hypothetical protein B9Q05_02115 [Candidatus Marsarchaeota G2 archaeon ECH_B_1]PSO08876.1 MAG: hypothetical protein B9Q04_03315 [Candidatus Marsarchaeota G2 archaeon BE_D]